MISDDKLKSIYPRFWSFEVEQLRAFEETMAKCKQDMADLRDVIDSHWLSIGEAMAKRQEIDDLIDEFKTSRIEYLQPREDGTE